MSNIVSTYFSQVSLLDDFNRANTGPPPSASWASNSFSSGTSQLAVVSNALKRSGAGWGSGAWGTQYGPDCLVAATYSTLGDCELELRGKDLGSGSTWDAYGLEYVNSTHTWTIYRTVNGTPTTLTSTTSPTLSAGDRVGFCALGSGSQVDLYGAQFTGGSWGADFITYSDTNAARLVNSGYIGLWANGTTPVFDDFYGGTITPTTGYTPRMGLLGVG